MVDIHSHLFNLKYLPVAGIIRRYTNNRIPHIIAIGVERLLLRGTQSNVDPENNAAIPQEESILKSANKLRPEGANKSIFKKDSDEIIGSILNKVTKSDLEDELVLEALDAYQGIEHAQDPTMALIDVNLVRNKALSMADYEHIVGRLGRLLKLIMERMQDGINYLRWFAFMQSSEHDMLQRLDRQDSPGIKLFVHQLLDIDTFFDEPGGRSYPSYYDYSEQVQRMEQLNKNNPDKLAGMVGFNPSKPNSLAIVDDAIKNRGFKGIKFYPPLGYSASNDPRFEAKITALLDYCVDNDVPLFTHCNNQGFEANPKGHSGYNSNPMFWKNVLKQPKYKNLRLCLAHAGGVHGWFAEVKNNEEITVAAIQDLPPHSDDRQTDWNSSYAKIVYALCLQYDNVYCDAAYLDEITSPRERDHFKQRLVKLFTAEPKFSKKIIYGSDWHMLFQEGKNERYFQDYKELFDEPEFTDDHRSDFFERNAKEYLKMA